MEEFTTGTGQVLSVHGKDVCHPPCPIHSPSSHPMRVFKLHWRDDRGIFERICSHGIGHPDPDNMAYTQSVYGSADGIHGCDGCCVDSTTYE